MLMYAGPSMNTLSWPQLQGKVTTPPPAAINYQYLQSPMNPFPIYAGILTGFITFISYAAIYKLQLLLINEYNCHVISKRPFQVLLPTLQLFYYFSLFFHDIS